MIMKEDENRIEEKTVRGAPGDGEALGEEEDGTENGV
jgi:hypothetical protein